MIYTTEILQIVLLSILGFLVLYLTALTFLALGARLRKEFNVSMQRRFVVVVPAHNEEPTIERTLRSLIAIEYAKDRFDIVVIADNCTDETAAVAEKYGTLVFERNEPDRRGKGYALRWCFDVLLAQSKYEAVVVIDADSVVSKNFLAVMNYYLDRGARVIQGSDIVEPQQGTWNSEMTRISFLLYNYVRPLGRKVIGCTTGLRGNGMCFSASVLQEVPWEAYSLNEDVEYGLHLLIRGIPVQFAPEAFVFAVMPQIVAHAESQRARWEKGRFPLIRKFAMPLIFESFRKRSYVYFDAFIELMTPALVNILMLVGILFFVTAALAAMGLERMVLYAAIWLTLLAGGFVHLLVGLYVAKASRATYLALLNLPRYVLWKVALYVRMLFAGKQQEWIRTTRESDRRSSEEEVIA